MRSFRGMDISSSTVHGWLTWPEMLKSFVPEFLSLPKPRNHEPPRRQIVGATDTVSTLATVVGQPNTPLRYKTSVRPVFIKQEDASDNIETGFALELTDISRKWGLQAGLSLLSFQRLNKSCLLPTDVRSSSTHHKHIEVITRATGILSNESSSIGFINSHLRTHFRNTSSELCNNKI